MVVIQHFTHCTVRLGDNLAHLHFLRKLAAAYPQRVFVHAAYPVYLPQMAEVVEDVPNLKLMPLDRVPGYSIDAWKNADRYWETHPLKNDYGPFYVEFFRHLAARMGLVSPIQQPSDLRFDYPAIQKPALPAGDFDFLVVNSAPQSGQWRHYHPDALELLTHELARHHRIITTNPTGRADIPCTQDFNLSVSGIGNLSLRAKHILMVSTGPSWPTFNIWNRETVQLRLVLIDHERVDLAPNTVHCRTVADAERVLTERGLL